MFSFLDRRAARLAHSHKLPKTSLENAALEVQSGRCTAMLLSLGTIPMGVLYVSILSKTEGFQATDLLWGLPLAVLPGAGALRFGTARNAATGQLARDWSVVRHAIAAREYGPHRSLLQAALCRFRKGPCRTLN